MLNAYGLKSKVRSRHQLSLDFYTVIRHQVSTGMTDDFPTNLDTVCQRNSNILLTGDFNIDMLKPHPAWDATLSLFGLVQMVNSPTRVTASSSTLIDHVYTNNTSAVSDVCVPVLSVSDHYPVTCSWSIKLPKLKKNGHTCIIYRSFKNFDQSNFLFDLANTDTL